MIYIIIKNILRNYGFQPSIIIINNFEELIGPIS